MKYKVIKSKEQYNQYCTMLQELLFTNSNGDEIELITLLIETWDRDHNSFEEADNRTLLRFLMHEHGLRHTDLADILAVGSKLVLEILNNKRAMPVGTAHKLSEYFCLSTSAFNR